MRDSGTDHHSSRMLGVLCFLAGLLVLSGSLSGCANRSVEDEEATMPTRPIEQVLADHTDRLMDLPGVTGVGQGACEGQPCIKVFVVEMTPALEEELPETLEGYRVQAERTGPVRALPENR